MINIPLYTTDINKAIPFYEALFGQAIDGLCWNFGSVKFFLKETEMIMLNDEQPIFFLEKNIEELAKHQLLQPSIIQKKPHIAYLSDPDGRYIALQHSKEVSKITWYEEAFYEFSPIVAHEYKRLHAMLQQNQIYGSILQLKDCIEVTMKLPIVIGMAQYYLSDNDKSTISKLLLDQPLALGHWTKLMRFLVKQDVVEDDVKGVLNNLLTLDDEHQIVNWRNDYIGHGALLLDEKKCMKDLIEPYANLLAKHYKEHALFYKQLKVELQIEENKIYRQQSTRPLNLFPFLYEANDHKIYFFDSFSYRSKRNRTKILNYKHGIKRTNEPPVHKEIVHLYHHVLNEKTMNSTSIELIDDKILNKFDQLDKIDYYVKPTYLIDWLNHLLEKYDKGIFHLQMASRMGKTSFIKSMDGLGWNKLSTKHMIRAIYMNDTFAYEPLFFTEQLREVLRQPFGLRNIHPLSMKKEEAREDFVRFLNDIYDAYQARGFQNKLVLCIDGLDELPYKQMLSIYDYLPTEKEMNKLHQNIYILLTSRTPEEMSKWNRDRLQNIYVTEPTSEFKKNEEPYTNLLQQLLPDHTSKLEKMDYDFGTVQLYKQLLNYTEQIENQPIERLLEEIRFFYGQKYFNKYIRVLLIMATIKEPVTIQEIAYLLEEDTITYELLAYMSDMKLLLKVERTSSGNVYRFTNEEWGKGIKKIFHKQYIEQLQQWSEFSKQEELVHPLQEVYQWEEGYIYLVSYLNQYLKEENLPTIQWYQTSQLELEALSLLAAIRSEIRIINRVMTAMKAELNELIQQGDYTKYFDYGLTLSIKLYEKREFFESKNLSKQLLIDFEKYKKNLPLEGEKSRHKVYLAIKNSQSSVSEMIGTLQEALEIQQEIETYMKRYAVPLESKIEWGNRQMQLLLRAGEEPSIHRVFRKMEKLLEKNINKNITHYKLRIDLYLQYSNCCNSMEKPELALKYAQAAKKDAAKIEKHPFISICDLAKIEHVLGNCYLNAEKTTKAIECYQLSQNYYEEAMAQELSFDIAEYIFVLLQQAKMHYNLNPVHTAKEEIEKIEKLIEVYGIEHEQLSSELASFKKGSKKREIMLNQVIQGLQILNQ